MLIDFSKFNDNFLLAIPYEAITKIASYRNQGVYVHIGYDEVPIRVEGTFEEVIKEINSQLNGDVHVTTITDLRPSDTEL